MKINVKCEVCGKQDSVNPSRASRYKTCSRECLGVKNSREQSQKVTLSCEMCDKPFEVKPSHVKNSKCCSRECDKKRRSQMYSGEGNPNYGNRKDKCVMWKGGKRVSNYGYILLHMPEHPMSRPDGYILEHRFVMSEYLGRLLERHEVIHHRDGNRQNNDITNLELTTMSEHTKLHWDERRGSTGK